METRSIVRGVRLSADKGRLVADMVRGKKVDQALNILTFTPKREGDEMLYVFEGMAVLDRFLSGIVELPKAVVAPTRFEPVFKLRRVFANQPG